EPEPLEDTCAPRGTTAHERVEYPTTRWRDQPAEVSHKGRRLDRRVMVLAAGVAALRQAGCLAARAIGCLELHYLLLRPGQAIITVGLSGLGAIEKAGCAARVSI